MDFQRLEQSIAGWNNLRAQNPTPQQDAIAVSALDDIQRVYNDLSGLSML